MGDRTRTVTFRDGKIDSLLFLVEGPEGATQFLVKTHWSHIDAEDIRHSMVPGDHFLCHPLPADVGFHSRAEIEYATAFDDCAVLGGPCWYDGSGLAAERLFNAFRRDGIDAVWAELDAWYDEKLLGREVLA